MTGGDNTGGPAARVVVLGASNVQIGLPKIVGAARGLTGGPIDLMVALGHGRSYGKPSSIPGRTLPAVTECRLWDDLATRPPASTSALVTDIGNDLLYGRSPVRVLDWVADCVDRLTPHGPVAVSALPTANLETLGEWRYRAFRTLFFPGLRLELRELAGLARELNDRLDEAMQQRGVPVVPLKPEWYGFDPIHYRSAKRTEAWQTLLAAAIESSDTGQSDSANAPTRSSRLTAFESLRVWAAPPAERRLLGWRRFSNQPRVTLGDGTRVSLY